MDNRIPDKAEIDLHVHPIGMLNGKYGLGDVIEAAEKKGINILGIEKYKGDIFPMLQNPALYGKERQLPREKFRTIADNGTCIVIHNRETRKTTYILRATEMMTSDIKGNESFHLLAIGDLSGLEIKKERPFPRIEKCIERIIKNEGITIIDHPYANADYEYRSINKEREKELEDICKEFKDEVALEWNAYCTPVLRFPLEVASSLIWKNLTGYNVNRKAEELAEKLKDYKIRVVADSDVHARNKRLLNGIGAGHIEIFKERMNYSSGKDIIKSIKKAIKIGELKGDNGTRNGYDFGYKNIKSYVSIPHFVEAFAVPAVLNLTRRRG